MNFCFPVCVINKSDSAIVSQQITTGKQICLTLGGLLKKLGNYMCCNECRLTCVVVLMVMLIGYLPEMRNKHFMKLIMKIGIVNFSSEFLVKLPN